jgi:hypothetical protein
MVKRNCRECNKVFVSDANSQYYCSKECFKKHRKEYNKLKSRGYRKLKPYDRSYRKEKDKEIHRKNYLLHKEDRVKKNKAYFEKNREKMRKWYNQYCSNFRKKNKIIVNAENKARKNISIPEGTKCSCGKLAVQRHHEDYSKPLEVMFVCRKCHFKLNKIRKSRLMKGGIKLENGK